MSRSGLIRMKGAPVTFTQSTKGTHTPSTDGFAAPTTTTIKGYALRATGDVETYKALELIATESITLDFVPKTAGQIPENDMRFTWGSDTFTVRSVEKVDQNGTATAARIIGNR